MHTTLTKLPTNIPIEYLSNILSSNIPGAGNEQV